MSNGYTTHLLDDDGRRTGHGDTIRFSYGIPPVVVDAKVEVRYRQLFAVLPEGHTPRECNLRSLRRYVGGWLLRRVRT